MRSGQKREKLENRKDMSEAGEAKHRNFTTTDGTLLFRYGFAIIYTYFLLHSIHLAKLLMQIKGLETTSTKKLDQDILIRTFNS